MQRGKAETSTGIVRARAEPTCVEANRRRDGIGRSQLNKNEFRLGANIAYQCSAELEDPLFSKWQL